MPPQPRPQISKVNVKEGIVLVNKPAGVSSFAVVKRLRTLTGIKKIGHAGTLDPLAEGLMIMLVGKDFTKKATQFLKLDKTYIVEMQLGYESTTGDREGELIKISDKVPAVAGVKKVLQSFVDTITQTPPRYSAIKTGGTRAYKLARQGKSFDLPTRTVTIYSITGIDYDYPGLRFSAKVSSGTYIRSLVVDIGKKLGTGAYTSRLVRMEIGEYHLGEAIELPQTPWF